MAGLVALAAVAGAVVWVALGLMSLGDRVEDLARVPVPGEAVVGLGAGEQAIYYEGPGGGEGAVPPLRISLVAEDGTPVEVGPHGGDVSYDINGYAGRSIAGYELAEPGRYRVTVRGRATDSGRIALGEGIGGRIVGSIVGGIVIFFGGLLLAGLLIIVTARRRRR